MAEDDNADSAGDKARHLVFCHLDKAVEPGSREFDLNSFLRSQSPCHSHSSHRQKVKDHVAGVSRLHALLGVHWEHKERKRHPSIVGNVWEWVSTTLFIAVSDHAGIFFLLPSLFPIPKVPCSNTFFWNRKGCIYCINPSVAVIWHFHIARKRVWLLFSLGVVAIIRVDESNSPFIMVEKVWNTEEGKELKSL